MMRFSSLGDLASAFDNILALAIPLLFGLCFLVFFWNGSRFVFGQGGESKDAGERKNWLIYGLIGLFAISALAGIISLVHNFLFLNINIQ